MFRRIIITLAAILMCSGAAFAQDKEADEQNRLSFANDCLRVVEEFKLDGIDIDWEYAGDNDSADLQKVLAENFAGVMKNIDIPAKIDALMKR